MKNLTNKLVTTSKTLLAMSLMSIGTGAYGDDTEVFYSVNVSKPNLLFVLDNSGSMNQDLAGNDPGSSSFNPPSRLTVLKNAVTAVLNDAPDNVNIGVMRYGPGLNTSEWNTNVENNRTHGVAGVSYPLTDINAKANTVIPSASDVYALPYLPVEQTTREYVGDIVNSWNATGGTPLVGSLYEAALYYRGEKMHYGQDTPNSVIGAHPSTYTGSVITTDITSTPRNHSVAPSYNSPILSSCQANYIVLMSDGQPTYYYNGAANTQGAGWSLSRGPLATTMRGDSSYSNLSAALPGCTDSPSGFTAGKCGPELTHYIATNDNIPDPTGANPNGMEEDQFIKTYSIGFGANLSVQAQNYLRSLETIDDDPDTTRIEDGYFTATDPAALAIAFRDILDDIAEPSGTLASPGYSVNVKSGLEHEKDIYIPVFDRKNAARWSGNLKKFRIDDEGGRRKIRGINGLNAVDELGGFSISAHDYWSENPVGNPDGIDVQKGGLANLINPDGRKVYSDIISGDFSNQANHLIENNATSSMDNAALGLSGGSTTSYRKTIINFMRGWEDGDPSAGIARHHMGDMLHSEPLVVTYNKGGAGGVGKEQYIFAGTNEGYLHAFNTETGAEKWAFIPSELLSTISESQFLNVGTQEDHKYGVDGTMTYWFDDVDGDQVRDPGDRIIIYFGLRRGGSSYYALDVTNIDAPVLLWKKSVSDYASMGQSWSAPYLARVGMGNNGEATEVVIISGGYDPDEDRNIAGTLEVDNASSAVTADVGNDILILDAENGDLLWSLSSSQRGHINSSIPGGVRMLDTNYNHLIDRMYFADTGGNVWRLDLSEKIGGADPSTLIKLAELGGGSRKFFNEPDVSIMSLNGKTVFTVSLGSGFRPHPLDKTITDKFYMLVDESPFKPLDTSSENPFRTIVESDLATITIGESSVSQIGSIKDVDKRGWKVNLPGEGEKVLATAVTFDGIVTFTTLVPEVLTAGVGIDQCAAPATQGRFYAISVFSGGAILDLDLSGGDNGDPRDPQHITDSDISILIAKGEIPGKPQTIFNPLDIENGECKHPVDIRIGKKLSQATGYDTCRLESVYWSDPVSDR